MLTVAPHYALLLYTSLPSIGPTPVEFKWKIAMMSSIIRMRRMRRRCAMSSSEAGWTWMLWTIPPAQRRGGKREEKHGINGLRTLEVSAIINIKFT
jgi:hypothetical protein